VTFDVGVYLDRIGCRERATAPTTRETLAVLMRAHVQTIPFENLDPVGGRAPSLDLDDIAAKLVVHGRRGGYCYEHNTLFAAVLRALGFDVTLHAARVMVGVREGAALRPRSHMLLSVRLSGEPAPYLADVGLGSVGALLEPIPLVPDATLDDAPRRHRLVCSQTGAQTAAQAAPQWLLQAQDGEGWANQYLFTLEPFLPQDFQVYNWYLSTYPSSPFHIAAFVQRTFPDRHLALNGSTLTETGADGKELVRELTGRDEVAAVLRDEFGIDVPAHFTSSDWSAAPPTWLRTRQG
jgi:N-hydroxyarylamine O-acetyltransferase